MTAKMSASHLALLFCALMFAWPAKGGDSEDAFDELTEGLPRPVARFLYRRAACSDWMDEEPQAMARANQIDKAVRALQCDTLGQDERNLRTKYRKRPDILKAFDAGKEW